MTYFTRRRDDVVVEESFDLVRLYFPQQSFNLQLDFPLPVNTYGNNDRTEQHQSEDAGDNHRCHVAVVFRAQLVLKAALRFVGWNRSAGPVDTQDVIEFVFLRDTLQSVKGSHKVFRVKLSSRGK